MSTEYDDNAASHSHLGAKYAVYHPDDNRYWLVDSGVGGTWSPDVEDACWWDTREAAIAELRATEILGPDETLEATSFFILRVY